MRTSKDKVTTRVTRKCSETVQRNSGVHQQPSTAAIEGGGVCAKE
jgi:hypothetical protein